eukprot:3934476-Rhodomonas_salina.1
MHLISQRGQRAGVTGLRSCGGSARRASAGGASGAAPRIETDRQTDRHFECQSLALGAAMEGNEGGKWTKTGGKWCTSGGKWSKTGGKQVENEAK